MGLIKVASLFTGCGGTDLGIEGGFMYLGKKYVKHNVKIVFANDNELPACNIFNQNFKIRCKHADIKTIQSSEIPNHDILTGGFPCQSFSIVAQNPLRLGYKDEKGKLFFEMVRILKDKSPKVFVAENVKGILSANNKETFPLIIKNFEKCGYNISWEVLNASNYGIPQNRERVFIIGVREDLKIKFKFKDNKNNSTVPLKEVIFNENEIDKKYYFSKKAVDGLKKANKFMNKGRAQDLEKPCNTVGAHLAKVSLNSTDPVLLINNRYRRFTPREIARIQSFPDSFILTGSELSQYRALGNAIPPVLMWHVMKELKVQILDKV